MFNPKMVFRKSKKASEPIKAVEASAQTPSAAANADKGQIKPGAALDPITNIDMALTQPRSVDIFQFR